MGRSPGAQPHDGPDRWSLVLSDAMDRCPYCESARSLLLGQVFCSRHVGADMRSLKTGTLYIRSRRLEESADHVSRLSIRCMLNGQQWYKVGGTDRAVHPGNFLVIDQGQHYRTAFHGDAEQEMLMVGFRPGFAAEVLRTLTHTTEQLLDNPWQDMTQPSFAEQTYPMDPLVKVLFAQLHTLVKTPCTERTDTDVDGIHDRLMERLLELQLGLRRSMDLLSAQRVATRRELWKRLSTARDHLEAHLHRDLHVADLAQVACLSEHHFKRLFRQAFGSSPYHYIRQQRLERARVLVRAGQLPLGAIASAVGYVDESSFVRLYRTTFGTTPGRDRGTV